MQAPHKNANTNLRHHLLRTALHAAALAGLTGAGFAAQIDLTKQLAMDPTPNALFGDNVSVDGDLAVVGAPGAETAYIYRLTGGVWVMEQKLVPWQGSAQLFGISCSISTGGDAQDSTGDVVAVGAVFFIASNGTTSGGAFTWRHDGTAWQPEQIIEATDAKGTDFFGFRLAMDHDVLVVGAPADELTGPVNTNTGTIYIFEFIGNAWQQIDELTGSGVVRADQFGTDVAVYGALGYERIVVGAPNEDLIPGQTADNEGVTYVFHKVSNAWQEEARIVAPDADVHDVFGWQVAVFGDVVAASAILDDEATTDAGAVYIYRAPDWTTPTKLMAPAAAPGDRFGELIALDGDMLLVGAVKADSAAGSVYAYRWEAGLWTEAGETTNPDPDAGDAFGIVGIQGGNVVIGAWKDDEAGMDAGAVYFGLLGNTPLGPAVVQPTDSATGTSPATLTFSDVTADGQTTVTSSVAGPPPPSGFQVGNKNLYYEISSSATFTGSITICIQYDEGDFGNEANIVLHHYEGGTWVEPPNQTLDTVANVVCADVTSLSPFAVLEAVTLDTDNDGLLDATELDMAQGSGCPDPLVADSDGDGLLDGQEVLLGTNPCLADSDGDGVGDADDPLPNQPGVTSGWLEDAGRELASDIRLIEHTVFTGPNPNARSGRRGALANRAAEAANAIAAGDMPEAIDNLQSLLDRVDGANPPPDWMVESADRTTVVEAVQLMLNLLAS